MTKIDRCWCVIVKSICISLVFSACERNDNPVPLDPDPINGVSSAFVSLEEYGVSIEEYTNQGELTISSPGTMPDIRLGSIVSVDRDTMGYLRRVVSIKKDGNKLAIQTTQAYLNDVFVEKNFKLKTSELKDDQIIGDKNTFANPKREILDKDGYIHPSEIIYYDGNNTVRKSLLYSTNTPDADSISIINFFNSLANTDIYGSEGETVHFYISEGYTSLKANAIFEFDFDSNGEYDEDTQVKRGDLKYFNYYLDCKAEFQSKLNLVLTTSVGVEDSVKLYDIRKKTLKFFVAGVPVWISIDCNVYGAYSINADASLTSDWGFKTVQTLRVGGKYNGTTDEHTPVFNYDHNDIIYPLNIGGEMNINARLEVYPRIELMVYSLIGPFADIVPYVTGNYNAAFHHQVTNGSSEDFLAWNKSVNVGLDLRVGAKLDFIGKKYDKYFGPITKNCFDLPLWFSPAKIELTTSIPVECLVNSTIPLTFRVKDNLNFDVNLSPISLSGDGKFQKVNSLTDTQGYLTANWTLDEIYSGKKEFLARILNASGETISEVSGQTTTIGGCIECATDELTDVDGNTYKTVKIGNQWWMAENLKTTKYQDGSDIPNITTGIDWIALQSGAYCDYQNSTEISSVYGKLYNFFVVEDSRNICPTGWHIPDETEWDELTTALGGDSIAGGKIKEFGYAHWNSPNVGATNETGFKALPAGDRDQDGKFYWLGTYGGYWSATQYNEDYGWFFGLNYDNKVLKKDNGARKIIGLSIRCIKD